MVYAGPSSRLNVNGLNKNNYVIVFYGQKPTGTIQVLITYFMLVKDVK